MKWVVAARAGLGSRRARQPAVRVVAGSCARGARQRCDYRDFFTIVAALSPPRALGSWQGRAVAWSWARGARQRCEYRDFFTIVAAVRASSRQCAWQLGAVRARSGDAYRDFFTIVAAVRAGSQQGAQQLGAGAPGLELAASVGGRGADRRNNNSLIVVSSVRSLAWELGGRIGAGRARGSWELGGGAPAAKVTIMKN